MQRLDRLTRELDIVGVLEVCQEDEDVDRVDPERFERGVEVDGSTVRVGHPLGQELSNRDKCVGHVEEARGGAITGDGTTGVGCRAHDGRPLLKWAVVGEGPLAALVVGHLTDRREHCAAVVSGTPRVRAVASAVGAHVLRDTSALVDVARDDIDVLLSVVNPVVLSDEVLAVARVAAVNYHDSLLPRLRGVNATTWCLLEGDREHGITWHVMAPALDAGPVLLQERFAVTDADTAETLNRRCAKAFVRSVPVVVSAIVNRSVPSPGVVVSGDGRIWRRRDRPARAGVVDWSASTEETSRLVRALSFGASPNPITTAKVRLSSGRYCAAARCRVLVETQLPNGHVVDVRDGEADVVAGGHIVTFAGLTNLEGGEVGAAELGALGAVPGTNLDSIDPAFGDVLRRLHEEVAAHDAWWAAWLAAPSRAPTTGDSAQAGLACDAIAVAAREARTSALTVAVTTPASRRLHDASEGLLADVLPVAVDVGVPSGEWRGAVAAALRELHARGTYARDLVARYSAPSPRWDLADAAGVVLPDDALSFARSPLLRLDLGDQTDDRAAIGGRLAAVVGRRLGDAVTIEDR